MSAGVALVTGGSRGIGRAIVQRLSAAGHPVVFTYTLDREGAADVVAHARAAGADVHALACDATDPDAPARLFDAGAALGDVRVLVHNAGVTGPISELRDASDATLRRVVDVDLLAVLRSCREASARWADGSSDRCIVNVSSIAARTGAPGEYVWYAACKAGVDALTRGLARELAPARVRVNAVAAGTTDTTIHARAGRPDRTRAVAARVPLGRVAAADEIAAAVVWLAGPDAGYVTGAVLEVTGGA